MFPIAIGGLGGSGTRVIANLLINCGIYLGDDLNRALDNLLFTFLFKRPQSFHNTSNNNILKHIRIFEKIMTHEKFFYDDFILLSKILLSIITNKTHTPIFIINRLKKILISKRTYQKYEIWGWKEPNTHIFLKPLATYFKNLKYIHVIRHGLDMAFSKNLEQLYNWGTIFGVKISNNHRLIHNAQLEYWIKANKLAINIGKKLLGKSFYLLNYDNLCIYPRENIKKLLDFLDLKVNVEIFEAIIKIPQLPPTMGRWKSMDINLFTENQINNVKKLGFKI